MKPRLAQKTIVAVIMIFAAAVVKISAEELVRPAVGAPHQARLVPLHVRHSHATATFSLADDAIIRIGNNSNASLADLSAGEIAHVSYTIDNGIWFAHEITINEPQGGHVSDHSKSALPGALHARSAIMALNLSNRSLTIRYFRCLEKSDRALLLTSRNAFREVTPSSFKLVKKIRFFIL